MNRIAAIDLGTNTFHVLIVQVKENEFDEVFRKRFWVNLAEFGISYFNEEVVNRIFDSFSQIVDIIAAHEVSEIGCVATEGFRRAENGSAILDSIKNRWKIEPEIISGEREAELIYEGIKLSGITDVRPSLIMDIGGGSTELILCNNNSIIWCESFKAGVTLLYNEFVTSDPIATSDIRSLYAYLEEELSTFVHIIRQYPCNSLIGASGSFEVLETLEGHHESESHSSIGVSSFDNHYESIIPMSRSERLSHPSIPLQRAKLIGAAFVLIKFVVERTSITDIQVSPYALKEGLIKEKMNI